MTAELTDQTLTALRSTWPEASTEGFAAAAQQVAEQYKMNRPDLLNAVLVLAAVLSRGEEFDDDELATQLMQNRVMLTDLRNHSDLELWWEEALSMMGHDADDLTLMQASTSYMTAEISSTLEDQLGPGVAPEE